MLIGCYCSVLYHMFTDISHPRIIVLGFKLHFKVSVYLYISLR
jgi:hypothetical protein